MGVDTVLSCATDGTDVRVLGEPEEGSPHIAQFVRPPVDGRAG
ncbi:hypothetical protein [Streptomyces sp. NPDC127084]